MHPLKKFLLSCIGLFCAFAGTAQGQAVRLDSLFQAYQAYTAPDTARVMLLYEAVGLHSWRTQADTVQQMAEEMLAQSRKLGFKKGEGLALRILGVTSYYSRETQTAEKHLKHSLALFREIEYDYGRFRVLNNLGLLYRSTKEYAKARAQFQAAWELAPRLSFENDRFWRRTTLGNIAFCHLKEGDFTQTVYFLFVADTLQTFFSIFFLSSIFILLIYNFSVFIFIRTREYIFYVFCLFSSFAYHLSERIYTFNMGTDTRETYFGIFVLLIPISFYFFVWEYLKPGMDKVDRRVLGISLSIPLPFVIDIFLFSGYIYNAYYNFTILIITFLLFFTITRVYVRGYKPALYLVVASTLLALGVIVQSLGQSAVLPNTLLVANGYEIGLLSQMILLSLAVSYKISLLRKEKARAQEENLRIIKTQNTELERKVTERTADLNQEKENLLQSRNELEKLNRTIAQKNKDITSSITYAKRIQTALLPFEDRISHFLPKHFILFLPRDIVSGDFYWIEKHQGKTFVVAADCTGHGVPGAFMSFLGTSLLNDIVLQRHTTDPAKILALLDQAVQKSLKQEASNNRDGMDVALCVLDPQAQTLSFSGAKNPLYYVADGELQTLKGSKFPVGGTQYGEKQFETTTRHTQPNEVYYLFSDGFQDQFGGPSDRKFGRKQLREMLYAHHKASFAEQRAEALRTFQAWKGEKEQIDDVLLIGFGV